MIKNNARVAAEIAVKLSQSHYKNKDKHQTAVHNGSVPKNIPVSFRVIQVKSVLYMQNIETIKRMLRFKTLTLFYVS